MPEPNATQSSDDRLDAIICEYLEAAERGSAPAQDEFVAQHPEFEDELREFFSDWQGIPARGNASDTLTTQHDDSDVVLTGSASKLELEDFELVREIGRGGMGQVFEARQRSLRRNVAVKAMSLGKTSARHGRLGAKAAEKNTQELRGRFVREAEVTGGLQHPGIVPVYAVGTAADGEPFYAMRLIEGESLHDAIEKFHKSLTPGEDYSRTRALDFRRLLRRLIDVCNAIDYAHSRQVIHRDIKPRNVMLGQFGETLVVDWGLAKHVGAGASLVDTSPLPPTQPASGTHQGSAVGTPSFMSPEQATGELERLGPASDVYSLGATLYCLLAGKQAFEGRDLLAIFERVKRGEFTRPRDVHPGAPPALEAVCLKAMSLDKSQRYASATALAEEIERWLADEPVTAYREPLLERCARWGRKHRTWLRAGALALVAVTAVATVSALLIDRERQITQVHRDQALARLKQSWAHSDWLVSGLSESLELHPGMQGTRKYLLEKVAADYEQFVTQAEDDPELELERGRAYLRLGEVRHLLREQQAAQEAFAKGQEIFDALRNERPDWGLARMEAANSRTHRALVLAEANQDEDAKRLYAEALALAEGLLKESPWDDGYREAWGAATLDKAALDAHLGNWDAAKQSLTSAMERVKSWQAEAKPNATAARLASKFASMMAEVQLHEGDYEGAFAQLNETVRDLDALVVADSGSATNLSDRASAHVQLAQAAHWLGHVDAELKSFGQAIEDFRRLSDTFFDVPQYVEYRALTAVDLAQCWLEIGDALEAKKTIEPVVVKLTELAQTPDYANYIEELATAEDVLAQAHLELGEFGLAADRSSAAIEQFSNLLAASDVSRYRHRNAIAHAHLALAHLRLGGADHVAAAREAAKVAVSELLALSQSDGKTPDQLYTLARFQEQFGELLAEADLADEGKNWIGQAQQQWQGIAANDASPAEQLDRAARFLTECSNPTLRDPAGAVALAGKALDRAPENDAFMTTLSAALYRAGTDKEESVALLNKAIAKRPHARAFFYLALQQAVNDPESARKNLDSGVEWLKTHAPGNRELQRLHEEAESKLKPAPAQ